MGLFSRKAKYDRTDLMRRAREELRKKKYASALPLLRGLTGTAITLLPKGESINRPCTVSWARPPALTGPFEIGLNFA